MMGFVIFGLYYAYDSVVPISDAIIDDLGITKAQYGLFFSYYSLPNLVMVLLGGILLDKIGIRKARTLFALIGVTGVLITATRSACWLMLRGRLLYGVGAESLCITEIKVLCFVGLVFSLLLKFSESKGEGTGIELPTKLAQAMSEI